MLKQIKQFFCFHSTVRVIRYHANVVPESWKSKLLYIDRYRVHNFVQCVHCSKVLNTDQREFLYQQNNIADNKGVSE